MAPEYGCVYAAALAPVICCITDVYGYDVVVVARDAAADAVVADVGAAVPVLLDVG